MLEEMLMIDLGSLAMRVSSSWRMSMRIKTRNGEIVGTRVR